MPTIVYELSGDDNSVWPNKGLLPSAFLSVKYLVMYMIGIANWAFSTHGFTPALACLIYEISTRASFDFGEFIFDM